MKQSFITNNYLFEMIRNIISTDYFSKFMQEIAIKFKCSYNLYALNIKNEMILRINNKGRVGLYFLFCVAYVGR